MLVYQRVNHHFPYENGYVWISRNYIFCHATKRSKKGGLSTENVSACGFIPFCLAKSIELDWNYIYNIDYKI
jgi:hypothetical protein